MAIIDVTRSLESRLDGTESHIGHRPPRSVKSRQWMSTKMTVFSYTCRHEGMGQFHR